jgi:hypothetical protein
MIKQGEGGAVLCLIMALRHQKSLWQTKYTDRKKANEVHMV